MNIRSTKESMIQRSVFTAYEYFPNIVEDRFERKYIQKTKKIKNKVSAKELLIELKLIMASRMVP